MSDYEQNDVLSAETEEKNLLCRDCGQKLSPENNLQGAFCDTMEKHNDEVYDLPLEPDNNSQIPPKQKRNRKKTTRIVLFSILSVALLIGIVFVVLHFTETKVTPQDINSINGCPEFYNIEFGMTVGEASRSIELEHETYGGTEGIYNIQWESGELMIALSLTISVDKTYYEGSVDFAI